VPQVSVIVPVYNRENTVGDAVRSILSQTHRELELILVDDGSTDHSVSVVEQLGDARVRVVRHGGNRGIPHARNTGLDAAKGDYVAWLDSDDVARPTRLAEQVAYLETHSDVAFVGSCAGKMRPDGRRRAGVRVPPLDHEDIVAWLLFRSAFQNSAITGRTDILRRHPYDPGFPVCEDVDEFQRIIAANYRTANLPSVLIDRRLHKGQTIRERSGDMQRFKVVLFGRQLDRLGVRAEGDDVARHVQFGNPKLPVVVPDADYLRWAENWIERLVQANRVSGMADERALRLACAFFWTRACAEAGPVIGWRRAARHLAAAEPARWLGAERGRRWLRRMAGVVTASAISRSTQPHDGRA